MKKDGIEIKDKSGEEGYKTGDRGGKTETETGTGTEVVPTQGRKLT